MSRNSRSEPPISNSEVHWQNTANGKVNYNVRYEHDYEKAVE